MLKKIIFLTALFLASCFAFGSASYADVSVGWAECTIGQTQSDGSAVFVNVTEVNDAFTDTWVRLSSDLEQHGLATALTAITLGYNVNLKIQNDGGFEIIAIRLIKE